MIMCMQLVPNFLRVALCCYCSQRGPLCCGNSGDCHGDVCVCVKKRGRRKAYMAINLELTISIDRYGRPPVWWYTSLVPRPSFWWVYHQFCVYFQQALTLKPPIKHHLTTPKRD